MVTPLRRHATYLLPTLAVLALPALALAAGASAEAAGAEGHSTEGELIGGIKQGLVTSITTLIVFGILVVILAKIAFGPIAASLKAREDKIRADIEGAEKARRDAEVRLKEYEVRLAKAEEEARKILTQAVADAERAATTLKAHAQQEAEEIRERGRKDLETEYARAITQFNEHVADVSTSIAEKILRRNINPADQGELIRSSLQQLETVGRN